MVKGGDDVSLNENDKQYIADQIKIGSLETVQLIKDLFKASEEKRIEEEKKRVTELTKHLCNWENVKVISVISGITNIVMIIILNVTGLGKLITFISGKIF